MKRSPWFNARRNPPVNGGPHAMYEHRCKDRLAHFVDFSEVGPVTRCNLKLFACNTCEWRGLLRESKK